MKIELIRHKKELCISLLVMVAISSVVHGQKKKARWNGQNIIVTSGGRSYSFRSQFTILYTDKNPSLSGRYSGELAPGSGYHVPTWNSFAGKTSDLREEQANQNKRGDGFEDKIQKSAGRTPNPYYASQVINAYAVGSVQRGDTVFLRFAPQKSGRLSAYIILHDPYPLLHFQFKAAKEGWYSIGYSGAPEYAPEKAAEIWQPLIWQEKRFPANSYLTPAFMAPLPTTLVFDGHNTLGILASPREFPFAPMPVMSNSRFGVMLRNGTGKAQPQLFAPLLGAEGSAMKPGEIFGFNCYLIVEPEDITHTYEKLARSLYGFKDYRHNDISSLNNAFDRIVKYSLSPITWIDSLKGCNYASDLPGSVKNASSLNPLDIALVTDNKYYFEHRALPMMEYMLSREKFLFSLDSMAKIQSPSRKLNGPAAPLSELVSLYNAYGKDMEFLKKLAIKSFHEDKVRNMDALEKGYTWWNAMHLYKATGEISYLKMAKQGADTYIKDRVEQRAVSFSDPRTTGNYFFWPFFTNRWIDLLQMYELTHEDKYLRAAQDGARHYMMFCWMSPAIPDSNILVNPGGNIQPRHGGKPTLHYPEEWAPAWRLSAMGLTAESAPTSGSHRAILMANYAPWMLRLGYYAKDTFLMQIAKAAVIGRYRNFPGYTMGSVRTTAYEKMDYPYHKFKDLTLNSFHFTHIMPMASMLLDYLITDVFARSQGTISFPTEYIEAYAYMQNNLYGNRPGKWYDEDSVQLWMPAGLLHVDNVELNYITARKGNKLFIAFTNQSTHTVTANVSWNRSLIKQTGSVAKLAYWRDNHFSRKQYLPDFSRSFPVEVSPGGITVVEVTGIKLKVLFQDDILQAGKPWKDDYRELSFGHARAMIFNLGGMGKRAYVYLKDNDNIFHSVSLTYRNKDGKEETVTDRFYPFEFTIPLDAAQTEFNFHLSGESVKNGSVTGETITMKE